MTDPVAAAEGEADVRGGAVTLPAANALRPSLAWAAGLAGTVTRVSGRGRRVRVVDATGRPRSVTVPRTALG